MATRVREGRGCRGSHEREKPTRKHTMTTDKFLKHLTRDVQAELETDPTVASVSYQWCRGEVLKNLSAARAALEPALRDNVRAVVPNDKLERERYNAKLILKLTELIKPGAQRRRA